MELLDGMDPGRIYTGIDLAGDIPSGWETDLLVLKARFQQGGQAGEDTYVLRCHDGPDVDQKASREFAIMRRLQELGYPVPDARLYIPPRAPFLRPCLLIDHISGQTSDRLVGSGGASAARRELDRLLAPLVELHRLPWQAVVRGTPLENGRAGESRSGARARVEAMEQKIGEMMLEGFRPLIIWLRERAPAAAQPELCLCHNDYHPQNLLVRDTDGRLFVLDWSFAAVDDYRLELAWSALLFGTMLGPGIREQVRGAYESLSGSTVEDFEFYEGLKLAERLQTLAAWLTGAEQIAVRKITPQAMRGEYKVHILNVYRRCVELTGVHIPLFEKL